jgi:signal transduction histidine kinase
MMEPRDRLEETMVLGEGGRAERALAQLASLPPDGDLEDGLYAVVSTFAEGADDLFIGVCVPNVDGRQLVVRHAPRPSQPRINDAARLFPEADDELVLELPLDPGSTLHVAGDSPAFYRDHEALALALGSLVRRWRFVLELRRDAGEVHSLRDKAVQSDKLAGLGRMAASIVHELNNPLTSIVAYADFLRKRWDEGPTDPADRERLGRISEAATRVLSFTRDLVAYSHDVLERALQFCEHVLESSRVTVERSYGDIPPIRGLHGPLTQVFVNLVTNACQAMTPSAGESPGGVLTLSTSVDTEERMVEVAVADEGHGIPAEHVDKLFEAYFTTRGDGGGNGLGLNIVRTIVHSHGGTVCGKNRTPSGSVFVVRLPYRPR